MSSFWHWDVFKKNKKNSARNQKVLTLIELFERARIFYRIVSVMLISKLIDKNRNFLKKENKFMSKLILNLKKTITLIKCFDRKQNSIHSRYVISFLKNVREDYLKKNLTWILLITISLFFIFQNINIKVMVMTKIKCYLLNFALNKANSYL
jgi:hypothetical protein